MPPRRAVLLLVALIVAAPASAQQNVRRIFAAVETSNGRPVVDVTAPEFHLTENGVERPVVRATLATTPMRIVLMVDSSAPATSMIPDFRTALNAFVDDLPPEHEVVLVSISGQMRVRVPPTTDRNKLHTAIANFSSDGGGTALIDGILEADRRFLRNVSNRWPVFVVLTTDGFGARDAALAYEFDAFLHNLSVRAGSAHAIVVRGSQSGGFNTEVARFLTETGHGLFERLVITNSLASRLKLIAARLASDHRAMAQRYELEYSSGSKSDDVSLEVSVDRKDAIVIVSSRRPF
jgi:VWA domain-containing protein